MEDDRVEVVEAPAELPAPPEPSTLNKVQRLIDRNSNVKNPQTGEVKPYQGRGSLGVRVITNAEEIAKIKAEFDNTKDASGRSMTEVCKEYWERKRRERS